MTFDADELAALVRHAADDQDGALYLAAAMTGLRQGELLALRWRDIDFAGQRVHVRRAWPQTAKAEKAPKSGKVRSVPLVAELIGPLDRLSTREHFTGDDDLVFVNTVGAHLDGWALRRRYAAALAAAGLRSIRFHDLRHCFGSVAVRAFPLSDVQAMLGHGTSLRRCDTSITAQAPTTPRSSPAPSAARNWPCSEIRPELPQVHANSGRCESSGSALLTGHLP